MPAGVPNPPGGLVVEPLAPYRVGVAVVVDVHLEVVAEGIAEAAGLDVGEPGDVGGEVRLRRPRSAAVGRAAVVGVPERAASCVHPRDAHVAGGAGHHGGEGV